MEYALEKKYMTKSPNNLKKCEEIGFKPGTDNFANCVLKLIELTALHERAVLESSSKNSIDAEMLQQQIEIQEQIAKEAKASRDQQAWGVLLGMTMGSGILDSSSGGLFSSSTVSCNKTGETTSGTNKICYYNNYDKNTGQYACYPTQPGGPCPNEEGFSDGVMCSCDTS